MANIEKLHFPTKVTNGGTTPAGILTSAEFNRIPLKIDEIIDHLRNPVTWESLTGKPTTFPPSSHQHLWKDIIDPPQTYTPSAHTHTTSDISNLETWISGKKYITASSVTWSLLLNKPSWLTPFDTYTTSPFYTKSEIDEKDKGYVHIAGYETITGQKTFASAPIVKSSSYPQLQLKGSGDGVLGMVYYDTNWGFTGIRAGSTNLRVYPGGLLQWEGSQLQLGGHLIEWDAVNNAFKFNASIYSTGEVSAYGAGSHSGGGGLSWDDLTKPGAQVIDRTHLPDDIGGASKFADLTDSPYDNSLLAAALNGKSDVGHTHSASDITSGTFSTARIPNLSASKITSGTLSFSRLPSMYWANVAIGDSANYSTTPTFGSNIKICGGNYPQLQFGKDKDTNNGLIYCDTINKHFVLRPDASNENLNFRIQGNGNIVWQGYGIYFQGSGNNYIYHNTEDNYFHFNLPLYTENGKVRIGSYILQSTTDGLQILHADGSKSANIYATGEVAAYKVGSGGLSTLNWGQLDKANTWSGANTFGGVSTFKNTVTFNNKITIGEFNNISKDNKVSPYTSTQRTNGHVEFKNLDELGNILGWLIYLTRNLS